MANGIGGGISAGDAVWTITGDSSELEKSLGQAEGAVSKSTDAITLSWKKVGLGMTFVGGAITGALGLATKGTIDFRGGLAAVATLGVQDMGMIEESVRGLSKTYGLDLVDATKAAYQAISAGVSEMDAPLVLEQAARAAIAGQSDLTTAIELGTAVTNAYGYEMTNVEGIFNQVFTAVRLGVTDFGKLAASVGQVSPIFAAAGLSSKEMFASVTALTKGGMATSIAVTGMKAALSNIIKPSSDAAEAAEQLGIRFDTTALKSLGLEGFLQMVMKATGGNIDTMARLFPSVEALGAVLALTGEQSKSFSEALAEMKNKSGQAGEAFQKMKEQDPGYPYRQMVAEINDLKVTVGDALLPALKSIVDAIAPVLESMSRFSETNPKVFNTLVLVAAGFGAVMVALGPLFVAIPGIIALFGAVGAPVIAAAVAIGATVGAIVYSWQDMKAGLDVIIDAITASWNWAAGFLGGIWEGMKSGMDMLVGFLSGVWDTITGVFSSGWNFISGIYREIMGMWDEITGAWNRGGILDMLGLTGGLGSTLETRATGGPVNSGQPYLVGEEGPELFVPNGSGTIMPNGAAGGGASVTINLGGVSVRSEADIRNLSERLAEVTARELRAAGAYT